MNQAIPVNEAWQFCPRCGCSSSVSGSQPFRCTDCHFTHYFSPFTAVGALITDCDGQMLFIIRGKDPGKGKLGMPGGFVDAGETAEQALVREVNEETGLQVVDVEYLASFPNDYAFSGVIAPVTDLFFIATVETLNEIKLQDGEIDGFRMLHVGEVRAEDFAFRTHQQALEAFVERSSA